MDLSAVIDHFDVLSSHKRDLRDPATQQIRALNQDVIAFGIAIQMSGPCDCCHQQPELLFAERPCALAGHQHRARSQPVLRQNGSLEEDSTKIIDVKLFPVQESAARKRLITIDRRCSNRL